MESNLSIKQRKIAAIEALCNGPWPEECVIWPGKRYAQIVVDGKVWELHRFIYTIAKGPIPDGLFILHECDQKLCFNPRHLIAGNQEKNIRDAVVRGRWSQKPPLKTGERNGAAKLSAKQVQEIREAYRPGYGSAAELARKYGVSSTNIQNIVKSKKWVSTT